jgi:putative zinc finger protein
MPEKDKTRKPQPPKPGGVDCTEFEVLLADALDGRLDETQIERFDAHLEMCPRCAPMFGEAKLGQSWMQTLKEDMVEPPAFVVENILRETVGTVHTRVKPEVAEPKTSWIDRLKEMAILKPVFGTVMQPRFAMSFGMAFFSITMLMNVLGVKVTSLRHVDLRPSAISRQYYETKGKVVKYYENMRLVYEIETRVEDVKRATQPDEHKKNDNNQQQQQEQDKTKKAKPENRETSGAPELKRDLEVRAANVHAGQYDTTVRSIAS